MELFYKRQLLQFLDSDEDESEITTEALLVEEPPTGVSLGEILGKRKCVHLLLVADACKGNGWVYFCKPNGRMNVA